MEQKFAELERERGEREAELAAAQQQSATRQLGPHQSLSDVLYTHAEDEEEDEEDLPDDDALPDAHKHAASGEVHRCSDADLEAKDAAERTPLFYAAAAGRADTVAAIVARAPHTASAVDANGDTALHAAASAGSADVARAILGAAGDIATVANGHGMHAAHLCSNAETLEVLLECGASFTAEDGQKRTPLFVACAMNRFECATFLLEVLDLEPDGRSAINAADARGDTPLHAAACNGAEACVRLLLESGTENIDARNAAGMRPRDLAAKRGHRGCERLLTEYALHIASDANFDTVLFLASLEGHRQCKKAFEEDTVPYEILRRTHSSASNSSAQDLFPTGGPSPAKAVARTKSRWSLKRGVSMKLAQWGNWIAYEEPDHATIFWYNHVTGAGQWTKPDAVTQAQAKHQSPDEEKHWEAMRHRSMRLSQTGDWLQYREHGTARPFWYHPKSGEFQWSRPDSLPPSDEAPLETAPEYTEAQPWAAYADPETGVPFWYNHVSGESQWEEPAGVDGLDEPAELCHSLDDLGI
ncbi:ankyrin repeat-containing domain protein [Pelagophyceae sp. CCMP2097]|nr:ankyrin repeat-containing domain protein [Pelagophyceae sp. CCMP2097]